MPKIQNTPLAKGLELERRVASIYRALGAEVQHSTSIAGNQIDVLVQETTLAGTKITKAIECKAYSGPVGVHLVNAFAALSFLLKERGLVDRFEMISTSGYTQAARQSATSMGIELLEIADLEQRVVKMPDLVVKAAEEIQVQDQEAIVSQKPKRLFVVMPFTPEFNDVYILGIRETAEKLGLIAERADEIEHIETIVDMIRQRIRECDAVVADTTNRNPNVFYEIGYANGVDRPVVFICRDTEQIPFDIQSQNVLKYANIVDLRDKLQRRLSSLFSNTAS